MGRSVSIVLITFNSARYLPACFEGISRQTHREVDVVAIDNASLDASAEAVRRLAPDARLIANGTNRGFAAAANQGIRESRGELVLLLNPDVSLQPAYLERLIDAMAEPKIGAATGKLLRGAGESIAPTTTVDSKGIRMTRSGRHFDIDNGHEDAADSDSTREVFGVSGAAALYRRAFLQDVAVGGEIFDESFFAYREDADLAWRGRLFGWKAIYVPRAIAYHVRRVTPEARRSLPPEINFHSVKNRFLLRLKNEGGLLALWNAPFELARDLIVLGATMTVERSSFGAWKWLWQHRREILTKREEIQRRRVVGDREIAKWFT